MERIGTRKEGLDATALLASDMQSSQFRGMCTTPYCWYLAGACWYMITLCPLSFGVLPGRASSVERPKMENNVNMVNGMAGG